MTFFSSFPATPLAKSAHSSNEKCLIPSPPRFYFLAQPTDEARQVCLHHLSIRVRRSSKNIGAVEILRLSGVDLANERKWSPVIGMRMASAQFVHRAL